MLDLGFEKEDDMLDLEFEEFSVNDNLPNDLITSTYCHLFRGKDNESWSEALDIQAGSLQY